MQDTLIFLVKKVFMLFPFIFLAEKNRATTNENQQNAKVNTKTQISCAVTAKAQLYKGTENSVTLFGC